MQCFICQVCLASDVFLLFESSVCYDHIYVYIHSMLDGSSYRTRIHVHELVLKVFRIDYGVNVRICAMCDAAFDVLWKHPNIMVLKIYITSHLIIYNPSKDILFYLSFYWINFLNGIWRLRIPNLLVIIDPIWDPDFTSLFSCLDSSKIKK